LAETEFFELTFLIDQDCSVFQCIVFYRYKLWTLEFGV